MTEEKENKRNIGLTLEEVDYLYALINNDMKSPVVTTLRQSERQWRTDLLNKITNTRDLDEPLHDNLCGCPEKHFEKSKRTMKRKMSQNR